MVCALAGTVLAACLVACTPVGAGDATHTPRRIATASPSAPTPPAAPPTPTIDVPVQSGALSTPVAAVPPVRLRIEALGVDMPVTDVGVEPSGQMQLPVDPAVAGWYRYGPDALSEAGNVMLAAHVDAPDYPIGPLARLRELGTGAPLSIEAADGSSRGYVVESLTFYDKTALPTAELFARDGAPRLVIITCGGPFDSTTGRYRDNVVAIARQQ